MEHYRLRKFRGPEVWERVRDCYIAGESGPSLALRFDVGLANLRKKAMAEGWTRNLIAERRDRELTTIRPHAARSPAQIQPGQPDPSTPAGTAAVFVNPPLADDAMPRIGDPLWDNPDPTPHEAVRQALILAGRRLGAGRSREAQELIKGAESLATMGGAAMPTLAALEREEADTDILLDAYVLALRHQTLTMIETLFQAEPDPPKGHEHWFLDFRRRHLRPSPHDADRDRLVDADREDLLDLYDDEAVLRPLPPDRPALIEATISLLTAARLHAEFGGTAKARIGLKKELLEAAKKAAG